MRKYSNKKICSRERCSGSFQDSRSFLRSIEKAGRKTRDINFYKDLERCVAGGMIDKFDLGCCSNCGAKLYSGESKHGYSCIMCPNCGLRECSEIFTLV